MDIIVTAFVISLREGIEVLLILMTIAKVIQQENPSASLVPIWGGGLAGIAANIALGIGIGVSGLHSKIADKMILITAAALMIYVARGIILLRFTGGDKENRIRRRVSGAGPTALFVLTFLLCLREAFELLLFSEALSIQAGGWTQDIYVGFMSAGIMLVGVYFMMAWIADRLPVRLIFAASSLFLLVQAGFFVWEAYE